MAIRYDGTFARSIFRWRGSVWRSVWRELLIWLLCYFSVKLLFMYAVPEVYHKTVVTLISQFNNYTSRLPLEFLVGFYVSQTVTRWWSQVHGIASPHNLMATITAYIPDTDVDSCRIRHTVARYLLAAHALAYRLFSSRLRDVYPKNDLFVQVGLLTEEEKLLVESAPNCIAFELPFQWANDLIRQKVGCKRSILSAFTKQRASINSLLRYNAVTLPLVYTQTVTVAVYGYFAFCLLGNQFYGDQMVDTLIPFSTVLYFTFIVGWLKVAQDLSMPFGDDDHDTDMCQFLALFAEILFTVADYGPAHRPRATPCDDHSRYDTLKLCFDANVLRFEPAGQKIVQKLKKLASRGSWFRNLRRTDAMYTVKNFDTKM